MPGCIGVAEGAGPLVSAVGEALVGPSVVFEAVVGNAFGVPWELLRNSRERGIPLGGWSAFGPCGAMVDVTIDSRGRHRSGHVTRYVDAGMRLASDVSRRHRDAGLSRCR